MQQEKGQPVSPKQMPTCQVCHLEPTPESVQHMSFIILEIMLLFYSLKLAAAMFLVSYCFAKNCWYCPQCKREIDVSFQVQGSSENIVLRIGNCMMMLTRTKFRTIAFAIVGYLLFSFITGFKEGPKFQVQKSWRSLANNCGYEAFMQNSFRANTVYNEYVKLGQWTIEGIFLREAPILQKKITRIYVKMSPTSFKNNVTEDVVVYQTEQTLSQYTHREIGDVVRFVGQWQGREGEGNSFRFIATKIQKTGAKADPNKVPLISSSERFIRVHDQEQKVTTSNIRSDPPSQKKGE